MADDHTRRPAPVDHASHDPELIVASLDRDTPPDVRAAAERLAGSCPACARLRDDLVSIAAGTASLPAPARPRDFTITADRAAAIRPDLVRDRREAFRREPISVGARLTGEMTDTRSRHAKHDRLLIANLLDRSPDPTERARAERQIAECAECARLHADLVALSEATKALPVPNRPRDFTLSAADADRIRIRGWRRLLGLIGSARDTFTRPLAIGLTTLGLAGLLVGTVPGVLVGGSTSALQTAEDASRNATGAGGAPEAVSLGSAAPSAAPASGPALAATAPTEEPPAAALPAPTGPVESTDVDRLFEGGESSSLAGEPADRGALDGYAKSLVDDGAGSPSAFVIAAGVLLLIGLGLFGLRWTARRLGNG